VESGLILGGLELSIALQIIVKAGIVGEFLVGLVETKLEHFAINKGKYYLSSKKGFEIKLIKSKNLFHYISILSINSVVISNCWALMWCM